MANDEKKTPAEKTSATPAKTGKKKRSPIASIKKWFREMRSELKKVMWPTPKQTINNTAIALAFMFVAAIVLWGFDSVAQMGVRTLISLVG